MRFAGWVLAALVAAPGAHAGRPLSTEDASTLDDRACQIESWIDRRRDDTLLHFSPGWSHDREQRRKLTTWGAAIERGTGERITLLAEAFGENSEKPFVRVGGRLTAIRDHLDLDLTWVTRPGGSRDERFVSLGVTWQGALLR